MHNLLLLNRDEGPFVVNTLEHIFRTVKEFRNLRFDEPGGSILEVQFVERDGSTFVRLNDSGKSVSVSGTSDVSLRAAMIVQEHLQTPLRIVDTEYSFDLILADFANLQELQNAIKEAQSS